MFFNNCVVFHLHYLFCKQFSFAFIKFICLNGKFKINKRFATMQNIAAIL